MKKIAILILLSSIWISSFAQSLPPDRVITLPVPATGVNKGKQSDRYNNITAYGRFFPPKFASNTAFLAAGGKDSTSIYYNTTIQRIIISKQGGSFDTLSTAQSSTYNAGYGLLKTGQTFKVDTTNIVALNPVSPQTGAIDTKGFITSRNPLSPAEYTSLTYNGVGNLNGNLQLTNTGALNFSNYLNFTEISSGKQIFQLGGFGSGNGNSVFRQRILFQNTQADVANDARSLVDVKGVLTTDTLVIATTPLTDTASNPSILTRAADGSVKVISGGVGGFVKKSGDTMTGNLILPNLRVNNPALTSKLIHFLTAGVNRWMLGGSADAESGANVGTDFVINRHADDGSFINTPLRISRATGLTSINSGLTLNTLGLSIVNGATNTSITTNTSGYLVLNPSNNRIRFAYDLTNFSDFIINTTGGLTLLNTGGFSLTGATSTEKFNYYQTGQLNRWAVGSNNTAETGSNNGSNFNISRYNDAGTLVDVPITINRSTGTTTIANRLNFNSSTNLAVGGATGALRSWRNNAADNGSELFEAVATTGNQSISGVKTFNNNVNINYATANTMVKLDASKNIVSATAGVDYVAPSSLLETELTKTSNYTITTGDVANGRLVLYADATAGAITITLPTVANLVGKVVTVIKTDASANVITVQGVTQNINGAATYTITPQYNSAEFRARTGGQYYAR